MNYRCVFGKWVLSGLLLMSFSSGCSTSLRKTASQSRDHAFIAYWPPAASGNPLRLAVKDLIDVKGVVTTAGSEYLAKNGAPAARDAKCLSIARQRNVQIVGKTTLSEFALSPTGSNDYYGTPKSPFSGLLHTCIPGGSSSGSALAIASGKADVAFGTDSTGSIRTPAACCGIVGLKTTFGLVPLDGLFPVEPEHLDTVGPMGKDIAHVVEGMDLLQDGFAARYRAAVAAKPLAKQIKIGRLYLNGPNPGNLVLGITDPGSLILGVADARNLFLAITDPKRLFRLGGTDPRIDKAVDQALAKTQLQVISLEPDFKAKWLQAQQDCNIVAAAGAWANDNKYQDKLEVSARAKSVLLLGGFFHATEYRNALRRQAEWKRTLSELFKKVDFIALPTLQTLPLRIPMVGSSAALEARMLALQNTSAVNFAGNPALAIPIPVRHADVAVTSLQLVGPRLSEAELLNAGRLIEASNPLHN
jgi:Asp-tRNA(Asn)/Glu-tRNA(Gln) amidotransferase A subunit family amidase